IFHRSENSVAFENGDDFVVGLVAVDHAQTADRESLEQEVAMGNGFFGKHTNVQGIVVAFHRRPVYLLRREGRNPGAAVGARNQPVKARGETGKTLGTIYFQIAGGLFYLVLDRVGGHDLDVAGDNFGRTISDRDAM